MRSAAEDELLHGAACDRDSLRVLTTAAAKLHARPNKFTVKARDAAYVSVCVDVDEELWHPAWRTAWTGLLAARVPATVRASNTLPHGQVTAMEPADISDQEKRVPWKTGDDASERRRLSAESSSGSYDSTIFPSSTWIPYEFGVRRTTIALI